MAQQTTDEMMAEWASLKNEYDSLILEYNEEKDKLKEFGPIVNAIQLGRKGNTFAAEISSDETRILSEYQGRSMLISALASKIKILHNKLRALDVKLGAW